MASLRNQTLLVRVSIWTSFWLLGIDFLTLCDAMIEVRRSVVGCSIMRERFRSNDEGGMSSVTMTIMEKLQGLPSEQQQAVLDMVELLERGEVRQSEAMVAHLETIAGLKQGFKELNAGQTRPIVHFIQSMQQKYDISG